MGPDISMDNALLQQLLLWNSEEGMSIFTWCWAQVLRVKFVLMCTNLDDLISSLFLELIHIDIEQKL